MKLLAVLALVAVAAAAAQARVLHTRSVPPAGWAVREAAEPETPVEFIVALKQQNLDQLEAKFWAVSDPESAEYRQFMTPAQIDEMVRPTKDVRARVLAWLSQYVPLEAVEDRSDSYVVKTVASVAELVLSTRMVNFHHHATGKKLVRQFGPYSIPAALDDAVDFVAGVSEFPDTDKIRKAEAAEGFVGIVPQTLENQYNAAGAKAAPGTNSSIAVIEWENQNYSPSDLASFAQQTNQTIPPLSSDHVVGSNQPGQPGDEAQLDIEWALIGNQIGWFWLNGQSAWLYGWASAFSGAKDVPLVASMSYGWSEEMQCQNGIGGAECSQLGVNSEQYVKRVNTEFQKIGLRGVSLFASSGDSGANGRTDGYCSDKVLHPTFPAASPYVTAVGATQLVNPKTGLQNPPSMCNSAVTCAVSGQETAVSYAQAHFASGGGFSNVASQPAYQKQAVSSYLSSGVALPPSTYYNASGRGYPDVGAAGSAIAIVYNGQVQGVGGTSASSPIFANYVAVLNDIALRQDGKPLGFMNPLLYKMAAEQPATFNDITVGDNKCTENGCGLFGSCKGYMTAKGWDPVTGLGSPNVGNMVNYVKNQLL